jgi:dipicolinate synthase subunit B
VIHTIADAEPIGPKALLDVLVIAPCTGNTLSKLAHGVTDTCVTMAAKAHWRNGRAVLIAVATNDALSGSAPALGTLLARRNTYFVPFAQDDAQNKPTSLTADFARLPDALAAAYEGVQLQPLLVTTP